jgi:hypothetical protein
MLHPFRILSVGGFHAATRFMGWVWDIAYFPPIYHPVVLAMCIHGFVIAGQKHPSDPYGPFPQGPFSSRCGSHVGNVLTLCYYTIWSPSRYMNSTGKTPGGAGRHTRDTRTHGSHRRTSHVQY